MSAQSESTHRGRLPGQSSQARRPIALTVLSLALAAGSLAAPLSALSSLTADLTADATASQVGTSVAGEAEGRASAQPSEPVVIERDDPLTLRSSDEKATKDAKAGRDAKDRKDAKEAGDAGKTKPALRADAKGATGLYQIRCWQDGRLVFEETAKSIDLPPTQYTTKFQGKDRSGMSLYIADTRNATCLIKGVEGTSDRIPTWIR